jgi:hypothetical protein
MGTKEMNAERMLNNILYVYAYAVHRGNSYVECGGAPRTAEASFTVIVSISCETCINLLSVLVY